MDEIFEQYSENNLKHNDPYFALSQWQEEHDPSGDESIKWEKMLERDEKEWLNKVPIDSILVHVDK